MEIQKKNVGQRIKSKRKERGFTQMAFSGKLGISDSEMSRIECGGRLPSMELLVEIADALNCSCDELLTGRQIFATKKEDDASMSKIMMLCGQASELERELIYRIGQTVIDTMRGERG